jgi:hypothetical protein
VAWRGADEAAEITLELAPRGVLLVGQGLDRQRRLRTQAHRRTAGAQGGRRDLALQRALFQPGGQRVQLVGQCGGAGDAGLEPQRQPAVEQRIDTGAAARRAAGSAAGIGNSNASFST